MSRVSINGKEVIQQHSLEDLVEPSARDINPEIYVRLSKPLKEDAQIDLLDLKAFYQQTSNHGLSINISPDYTFNEHSTKIIEKNQQLYDDFNKSLNEIEEIKEPALRAEFKAKIEEFVAKKIKDTSIQDVHLKDCKITEETLKFNSESLNELSEDCKKYHIGIYL